MADLPRPNFIDRSIPDLEAAIVAQWEQAAQKPLLPAQAERLLINLMTYREALLRIGVQWAAEQNLVNYAQGLNLDQLGALMDVQRLSAASALTTLQFTRSPVLPSPRLIPAGTLCGLSGAAVLFRTQTDCVIPANEASATSIAECTTAGVVGNGYAPGVFECFVPESGLSVENISTSNGGADVEDDDRLRRRIKLAPHQFSVAGSEGAYLFHALSSDRTITDVAILSPRRVQVEVYPLTVSGLPSVELRSKVQAALASQKVRPLTDNVTVLSPVVRTYSIAAEVTLYSSADSSLLGAQLNQALADYVSDRRSALGRDVVRSQIVAALSLPGVYRVSVVSPAVDVAVLPQEWATATTATVTIVGVSDG